MGWGASAGTGIMILDYVFRPLLKVCTKFPIIAILFLCAVYGVIGYLALKSAYLSDR